MSRQEIERLAYGYELMHRAICNMAGTSGAEGRWYMHLAQEALSRVAPVWRITAESNAHKPGDCLTGYRSFLASCDEHPEGEDPKGLSGEAMPARSCEAGDAHPSSEQSS